MRTGIRSFPYLVMTRKWGILPSEVSVAPAAILLSESYRSLIGSVPGVFQIGTLVMGSRSFVLPENPSQDYLSEEESSLQLRFQINPPDHGKFIADCF